MKNFFDHSIKVKFFDGILEHSNEWQWLVEEIEREFEGFKEVSNFQEFMNSFLNVKYV